MTASLSMLGVLLIGLGGYFIVTLWDSGRRLLITVMGGLLILLGLGFFVADFLR